MQTLRYFPMPARIKLVIKINRGQLRVVSGQLLPCIWPFRRPLKSYRAYFCGFERSHKAIWTLDGKKE